MFYTFSIYIEDFDPFWVIFYERFKVTVCIQFLASWCLSVSASLVKKIILFPKNCLCSFCQRSVDFNCVGLFLDSLLCSTDPSVISTTPHCPDYWSFIASLEGGYCQYSNFIFFLNIVLAILDLSPFHINFRIFLLISTK